MVVTVHPIHIVFFA